MLRDKVLLLVCQVCQPPVGLVALNCCSHQLVAQQQHPGENLSRTVRVRMEVPMKVRSTALLGFGRGVLRHRVSDPS